MEEEEPVSPTGQYLSSSVLNVTVLVVFETSIPIDDSQAIAALQSIFLPINPRFSSIMVRDEHGVQKWRKVQVKLEEHLKVPVFPQGLEQYDEFLQDYITKISMEPLPFSKPLWDVSVIKYPTSTAAGTFVFRLHHALGDGYSLMAALFSCLKRVDDPSLPLTFPSSKPRRRWDSFLGFAQELSYACVNTIRDFGWSLMKSSVIEDSVSAIRSGVPFVESRPINLSYFELSLDDIKTIKKNVNGTINDVLVGIIFYGINLYMEEVSPCHNACKMTALVLLNTRAIRSYKSVEEMRNPNSKAKWGNYFAFLHIPMPKCDKKSKGDTVDPLDFVLRAKKIIELKRSSFGVYLSGALLEMVRKLTGPEVASRCMLKTLTNSSIAISNMIGPMEQVEIIGHPVSGFHFMMVRAPQSLTMTIVSYMQKVRVAVGAEKGFIDSPLLVSCMKKSFESIYEASVVDKENQFYSQEHEKEI
ncbi:O-acyltransferase WSD1-like [Dioscorea cayenensis subsp. rotundata]|uniref:O-acyltransferase WSD1-like n=1 Tax=Dioscorea cayennensis subsp. rotundata TaxID=55577 RepID=A0AB40C6L1_DIOCR|nr:O-acyltransferase WSD1-like [Dioscorea cayenensis subsp. rotundata]